MKDAEKKIGNLAMSSISIAEIAKPVAISDRTRPMAGRNRFLCKLLGQERGSDRVLVYAPSKRLVFEVNKRTWGFLSSFSGRSVSGVGGSNETCHPFFETLSGYGLIDDRQSEDSQIEPTFKPTRLILLPTADCNLRCAYCFSAGGKHTTTLSLPVAKAAVDLVLGLLAEHGGRQFHLSFLGGGEPTVAWDLLQDTWEYAFETSKAKSLAFDAAITTNGTWNRSIGEWLTQHIRKITVSLNGTANVMLLHRPTQNGKNVFETVVRNISFLIDKGCTVGIRSTVSAQSLSCMDAALKLFHSLGVRKVHFEPLTQAGRAHESGIMPPSQVDFVDAFWSTFLLGRALGIRVTSSTTRFDWNKPRHCMVAEKAICVTPGARLTSCHRSADDPGFIGRQFHYGHYDPNTQQFLIDRPLLESMLTELATRPQRCRKCIASIQCTTGCYYNNLLASGTRTGMDSEWCEASRELTCRLLEEELHAEIT